MTRLVSVTELRLNGISRHFWLSLGLWLGLLSPALAVPGDQELILAIQPVLSEGKTREAFEPLAQYISKETGKKISISTMPNFMAYWSKMVAGQKSIIYFDAAHFTAFRARKQGYRVLAKIPDSVSYTLIVRDADMVFEPSELVAKRIATLGSPSIGAARLSGMFPNPMRQPIIIEVANSQMGISMLLDNKVFAAIIPTPIVSQAMDQGLAISVVTTTEPIPHIAVSASPDIDKNTMDIIRRALIAAQKQPDGKIMLKKIGFAKFDPANETIYIGQDKILKDYWGY